MADACHDCRDTVQVLERILRDEIPCENMACFIECFAETVRKRGLQYHREELARLGNLCIDIEDIVMASVENLVRTLGRKSVREIRALFGKWSPDLASNNGKDVRGVFDCFVEVRLKQAIAGAWGEGDPWARMIRHAVEVHLNKNPAIESMMLNGRKYYHLASSTQEVKISTRLEIPKLVVNFLASDQFPNSIPQCIERLFSVIEKQGDARYALALNEITEILRRSHGALLRTELDADSVRVTGNEEDCQHIRMDIATCIDDAMMEMAAGRLAGFIRRGTYSGELGLAVAAVLRTFLEDLAADCAASTIDYCRTVCPAQTLDCSVEGCSEFRRFENLVQEAKKSFNRRYGQVLKEVEIVSKK